MKIPLARVLIVSFNVSLMADNAIVLSIQETDFVALCKPTTVPLSL